MHNTEQAKCYQKNILQCGKIKLFKLLDLHSQCLTNTTNNTNFKWAIMKLKLRDSNFINKIKQNSKKFFKKS